MSSPIDRAALAELALFQSLGEEDLDELAALLHRRSFPPGTRVMSAEQPGEALYLILDGSVKVQLVDEEGHEVTLALLGPGDTVGEMSLLEATGRSADVVTLEETTFVWMDRGSFLTCLERMKGLNHNLVRELSERLRAANEQIRALSTLDVTGRVVLRLVAFAERYGRPGPDGVKIPLPLTQSDIAEMVGASRERVNHVMVALKREGLVESGSDHHLTVRDLEALRQFLAR